MKLLDVLRSLSRSILHEADSRAFSNNPSHGRSFKVQGHVFSTTHHVPAWCWTEIGDGIPGFRPTRYLWEVYEKTDGEVRGRVDAAGYVPFRGKKSPGYVGYPPPRARHAAGGDPNKGWRVKLPCSWVYPGRRSVAELHIHTYIYFQLGEVRSFYTTYSF